MVEQRLARLRSLLEEEELDAFLALKLVNTYYLSGFTSLDTARPTSYVRPILVVVDREGACLVVPSVDDEAAEQTSTIRDIRVYSTSPVREAARALAFERLREVGARRVGVEEDSITAEWIAACAEARPEVELVHAGHLVERVRRTKDEDELELLRRAAALSDLAIQASLDASVPGKTELDADTAGLLALRASVSADGDSATVDAITAVMSGPRGSMPHELTTGRAFLDGELTWHAWLVAYRGYWVENVRTRVVNDSSREFDGLHDLVEESLRAGEEAARPGTPACEVFRAVMGVLKAREVPGGVVMSRSGHGVGLEYHEPPFVEETDTTPLEPGMVLTVEPGLWLPGVGGITLSNTLVIGETENETLTRAPVGLR